MQTTQTTPKYTIPQRRNQNTQMSNQNNQGSVRRRNRIRRSQRQIIGSTPRSSRIHRRELWFEVSTTGTGSKSFDSDHFPLWFNNYSKLYETYRMRNIRVHWTSGYSQFAGGYVYASYNTNPSQVGEAFSPETIFAQQNAGRSKLSANGTITIPPSAYLQQPNRRQCSGPNSFLFEFRYYISANNINDDPPSGSITFWIEYDCTFYTPQISLTGSTPDPTPDPEPVPDPEDGEDYLFSQVSSDGLSGDATKGIDIDSTNQGYITFSGGKIDYLTVATNFPATVATATNLCQAVINGTTVTIYGIYDSGFKLYVVSNGSVTVSLNGASTTVTSSPVLLATKSTAGIGGAIKFDTPITSLKVLDDLYPSTILGYQSSAA